MWIIDIMKVNGTLLVRENTKQNLTSITLPLYLKREKKLHQSYWDERVYQESWKYMLFFSKTGCITFRKDSLDYIINIYQQRYHVYYYLTRPPWAASSQGIQDDSGAKSDNWLADFVSEVSTSFSISFS